MLGRSSWEAISFVRIAEQANWRLFDGLAAGLARALTAALIVTAFDAIVKSW